MKIAFAALLLGGCHQQADATDYLILTGFVVFVWIIYRVDQWLLESGYRVEPAPYVGLGESSKVEQKSESQKAGDQK